MKNVAPKASSIKTELSKKVETCCSYSGRMVIILLLLLFLLSSQFTLNLGTKDFFATVLV